MRRLAALMVLGLAACSTAPDTSPSLPPSVRPGINDSYRTQRDFRVWMQRFQSESREIWTQRHAIIDALGLGTGMKVADIGTGTGFFAAMMHGRVGEAGRVYAVDLMPYFVDHVRHVAVESGLPSLEPVQCREDSVELPPRCIGLALLCDTYHHLEYPQRTLASIHRALKPGGELVVIDFKRIPGKSRAWVLGHVRAGQEEVAAEIAAAGFELAGEERFLKENYFMRFRKPAGDGIR